MTILHHLVTIIVQYNYRSYTGQYIHASRIKDTAHCQSVLCAVNYALTTLQTSTHQGRKQSSMKLLSVSGTFCLQLSSRVFDGDFQAPPEVLV